MVESIDERKPHSVSEVICVRCGKRWISVRPEITLLKKIECEKCGAGYVIETGQILDVYEDTQHRIPYRDQEVLRRQVMTEHFIIRNIALNAAGD